MSVKRVWRVRDLCATKPVKTEAHVLELIRAHAHLDGKEINVKRLHVIPVIVKTVERALVQTNVNVLPTILDQHVILQYVLQNVRMDNVQVPIHAHAHLDGKEINVKRLFAVLVFAKTMECVMVQTNVNVEMTGLDQHVIQQCAAQNAKMVGYVIHPTNVRAYRGGAETTATCRPQSTTRSTVEKTLETLGLIQSALMWGG